MITGKICILDSNGEEGQCVIYKSKSHRNEIIEKWKITYALKNKIFIIKITPNVDKIEISEKKKKYNYEN